MKPLLLFLFASVLSLGLSSQITLNSLCNLPRSGDRLVKQQVDYKAPGGKGVGVVWDFSDQTPLNDHYELNYRSLDVHSDTLVGTEHRTMYYYYLRGDSLYSLGYENPTTLITYRKPETLLVFPFTYGRTFTDYFEGTGSYCDQLDIHVQGKSQVTADASGMLVLPGGDTLRHVLRVHHRKCMVESMEPFTPGSSLRADTLPLILNRDSIDWYLANDSSSLQVDTWRWYADGYRYPIFESVSGSICCLGKASPYFATSFYYPPHEQYYALDEDSDNRERRDGFVEKEYSVSNGNGEDGDGRGYSDERISYGISIDTRGELKIDYLLNESADVLIGLYDLQGRQLSDVRRQESPAGRYTETLSLVDFPDGEYLLRLVVGGKTYGEKVLKR